MKIVLCEVAHSAIRTKSQFHGFFEGLVIRRGKKRAIMAVGHKLLGVVYTILSKMDPYRDPGIDYKKLVVARNAARWLRALEDFGYLKKVA